jgi:hypothetical protein
MENHTQSTRSKALADRQYADEMPMRTVKPGDAAHDEKEQKAKAVRVRNMLMLIIITGLYSSLASTPRIVSMACAMRFETSWFALSKARARAIA